jgi:molybdopterin synthase catalytic subunit
LSTAKGKIGADEMRRGWEITDTLLIRREGKVSVGEIISLVAVSAPAATMLLNHAGMPWPA